MGRGSEWMTTQRGNRSEPNNVKCFLLAIRLGNQKKYLNACERAGGVAKSWSFLLDFEWN